ncbi:hypothetical protein ACFQ12_04635, partial [Methylobacterium trifolii]
MEFVSDLATLRLCSGLASLGFAFVFLSLWGGRRGEAHWLHWASSSALYAAVLAGFQFATSPAVEAVLYGVLAATNLQILMGVRRFDGLPALRPWMGLPVLAAMLAYGLPALTLADAGLASTASRIGGTVGLAASMGVVGTLLVFGRGPTPSRG